MVAENIYDLLPMDLPKSIGDLPSTATDAVAIIEYNGGTSTEYFGKYDQTNSIFNPIIKIVVRNASYATGSEWSESIGKLLHRYHDDTFLSILMVGSPIYLGRDEQKLHEFQVTFTTQVRE